MKKHAPIFLFGAVFLVTGGIANAQQTLLPGATIPKFVEPLPVAGDITVVDATSSGKNSFPINAHEVRAQILPTTANWRGAPKACRDRGDTASSTYAYLTTGDDPGAVRSSYLGPVVIAERGVPAYPEYSNNLPELGVVQQNMPIDLTLDWANPFGIDCMPDPVTGNYTNPVCGVIPYIGPIPIAAHLHGGEVAPAFDGGPDAWFTPGNVFTGSGYPGSRYTYDNGQQESTIWFHDHALGITRLNVYAGLAGIWEITDPANPPLATMPKFPDYDIPFIIQDRSFDTNCEIFYNVASNPQPNPELHPFWTPEFIGDTIVVNGKTWPYLEVEPRQYRFRYLNGSNARFYELSLQDVTSGGGGSKKKPGNNVAPPQLVIATDNGYLANAAASDMVILAPGERYEVIIDFSGMAPGTVINMMNSARTPYPGGGAVIAGLTDTVMQFRVNKPLSTVYDDANNNLYSSIAAATPIRPTPVEPIVTAHNPASGSITRQLTLNEIMGPGGPAGLVINNSEFNLAGILPGSKTPLSRETELPAIGDTEIWEIINVSADAHPMHIHLTSFQLIDRTPFDLTTWLTSYESLLLANGVAPGGGPPNQYNQKNADGAIGGNPPINALLFLDQRTLPLPYERGWKDTVVTYPGEVTRIAVRWATTDSPATGPGAPAAGVNTYPFDPTVLAGGVGYVWHCHILDHEDNEMMRNYVVGNKRQQVKK